MKIRFSLLLVTVLLICCKSEPKASQNYVSPTLKIIQITPNVFQHISYLETQEYGKVPCNGMIYFSNNEAIVFDTPASDTSSKELINWVQNEMNADLKSVIITHFHIDCLGGLKAFHQNNILSYANKLTIDLARKDGAELPKKGFHSEQKLSLNDSPIINTFFGRGHTYDNIVSYIPDEKVLFGGCLVKGIGAKKGNLADADTLSWSSTVEKIRMTYPEVKFVVPGHGNTGNAELLDYTIDLFKN